MQILKAFSKRVIFNLFKTKSSILIAIMCVVAVGCSKDEGANSSDLTILIGVWEMDATSIWDDGLYLFIFNKNRTYVDSAIVYGNYEWSGKYVSKGNYLIYDNKIEFHQTYYKKNNEPIESIGRYDTLRFRIGKDSKGEYLDLIDLYAYGYNRYYKK